MWRTARCEVCGNDYGMTFEVHAQGAVRWAQCAGRSALGGVHPISPSAWLQRMSSAFPNAAFSPGRSAGAQSYCLRP
ncbi:hypothetical protein HEP87_59965 [Streptomyces sp. S1D4-11]